MARIKIAWTEYALRELTDIRQYIAKDSVFQAGRVCGLIRDVTKDLKQFPEGGAVVPEVGRHSIREIHVFSYRIIYEYLYENNQIRIISIFHAARQMTPKLIDEMVGS